MNTEEVKNAIIALAGMTVVASITPSILAAILEKMRNLNDSDKQSLKDYVDTLVNELKLEINKKQSLLTSGVDIKTLNGMTLLGEGNITIQGATGEEATKLYVDELVSTIYDEIAKKQPALVSGVNIRTINGQSLVGDGNITIQGGEGQGNAQGTTDYTQLINKPFINGKLLVGNTILKLADFENNADFIKAVETNGRSGFNLVYSANMVQVKYADHVLFNIAVGDEEEAGLISPIDLRRLQYVYDKVGSGTIAVPVPTKNLVNAVNYLYERLKNAGTGGNVEAIEVAELVADRLYISQNPGGATVYLCVGDMPDKQNDIECFTIDCVDSDVDNYAGLMSPEDKRNLDSLSQKVSDLEQNQTTFDDVKEAMESLPDGQAVSAQVALNKVEVEKMQILDNSKYDWAIGDANGNVLIACKNGHIFTEKFNSSVVNKTIVDLQKNTTVVPDTIDFSEETDWISTARNYILKGDNTTLQISDDLGKTWKSSTNPVGQIVFVHWFSNGTCLICSPTKAYYTTNYTEWIQSDIKDADGNTITISDSQWCFNMMNSYNSPVVMIGDKEFCMWGDYGHSSGYTARIWCSDDYGATVKCVLKNGYSMTTHADGEKTLNITHFHHCMWDNIHKCYWITTGDYTDKNQLIKGTYEDNAWKFETVLSGDNAKFIMVWADDTYLYALTDYTTGIQTGLLRCPLNRISDINNWKFIWSPENNECLGNMFADAEGNMVITGDDATWKKFWYAHGDVDFKAIENTSNLISGDFCIHYLVGPNYNGDVIASLTTYGWGATKAQCGWNVSKRVLFSKAMRDAGAKDFGKQKLF